MKRLTLLLAIAALLTACEKSNGIDDGAAAEAVALKASAGIANRTRAMGSTWSAADVIGIFMVDNTGTLASNHAYETTAGDGSFAPADDQQTIWFPIADDAPKVDFIAYYPWSAHQVGFTYNINVYSQSDQFALDLMTADRVTGKDKTSPAVDFTFHHRLTKMRLTLKAAPGMPTSGIDGIKVQLTGQQTTATCNLTTGDVTTSGDVSTIELSVFNHSAEAIILPAEPAADRQLIFTLTRGDVLRYTIPADRAFRPGELHDYEITLNPTGVSVTSNIVDWVRVTGDGTAD